MKFNWKYFTIAFYSIVIYLVIGLVLKETGFYTIKHTYQRLPDVTLLNGYLLVDSSDRETMETVLVDEKTYMYLKVNSCVVYKDEVAESNMYFPTAYSMRYMCLKDVPVKER